VVHGLLHDPLIQTDRGWHSLPGLLAAMTRGEVSAFPALRPHQRPAWHMFLVQLGVLALDGCGQRELPDSEEDWRTALRGLTADFADDAPWHLVGADRARPAFLQPPDPGGLNWSEVATPDALDMLITARNHDVKRQIARNGAPQDWIFALVSLQTMEGYQLKYSGIVRMKSGASSRVMLALAPPLPGTFRIDISAWWRRDVVVLLDNLDRRRLSKKLLWIEPWPDGAQISFEILDQLFIEVCRRVRLISATEGKINAEITPVLKPRISVNEWTGNSGDLWAPITADSGEALTLGARDFDHTLLVDLLVGRLDGSARTWKKPTLLEPHGSETATDMLIVAEAFARGKDGKTRTDGFRSRVVPVPKAMVSEMFGERPAEVADGILKDIAVIDLALRDGLALVAAGGDREKVAKPHYARAQPAREALRRHADAMFFPELWARMAVTHDSGFTPLRLTFLEALAVHARDEFRIAVPSIPCASLMRPRAEVRGRRALERGLGKAVAKLKREVPADV
jgi:CRISPR system Cascade subunit CasA